MPREPEVFGQAGVAELLEHLAHDERHGPDVGPGHAGTGVEVDPQLVGMVEVARSDRMRVEVDAAEVDDPRQRGAVVDDHLVGGAAGRERELDGAHELRDRLRRALLEECLTLGAVDEALEGHRAVPDADERAVGDREVVADEVELGDAGIGEEELAGVADRDLVPVEGEGLGLGACHRSTG